MTWMSLLPLNKAYATSVSLRVSPPSITIQTKAPNTIKTPLSIENRTEQPMEFEILLKPFRAKDSQGNVSYLENFDKKPDPDILKKVTILEDDEPTNKILLGPFQKKTLTFSLHIPTEQTESDYYFSILFISNPEPSTFEKKETITKAQVIIASHILLSIQNISSSPKGTIEEFSGPFFSQKGPIPFTLRVRNTGSHAILPQGIITIKNMFSQTVGAIGIKQSPILIDSEKLLVTEGDLTKLSWQNGFLLGPYTARLTLALSKHGPTFTRSVQFVVLPLKETGEIVGIFILILFVIKRIKKHQ